MAAVEPLVAETPEAELPPRWTVAVDFDGVLHSYVSGWQGADVIPDPPVDGAIDWLHDLLEHFDVVVLTTRAREEGGVMAVTLWLASNGLGVVGAERNLVGSVVVTAEKVPALVYIDDRAFRFRGRFPDVQHIRHGLKPWRVGDSDDGQRTRQARAERHREYVLRLEASNARLKRERYELRAAVVLETLRCAGIEGEVADEWMRQHGSSSHEQRLDAARALRDTP